RQQASLINTQSRGRSGSIDKQVGNYSGIVLMPMPARNGVLPVDPPLGPARAGQFIGIAVIAVLHDEIDAGTPVPVVVVVGLPDPAVGIHRQLVWIPEIMADHFQFRPVGITAESHTLPIRRVACTDSPSQRVKQGLSVGTQQCVPLISEIKI